MITPETERDKYSRMWANWQYRQASPGERLVPVFIAESGYSRGETLIDVGCGSGRAAGKLCNAGLIVTGLDITPNCLDSDMKARLPFIEGCLWNLPRAYQPFCWFYCTDVMEHIPPEHVDAALDNLKRIAKKGFFQIALFDEAYGNLIGEKLHLTIQPREWWMEKLGSRWTVRDLGNIEWERICCFVE